MEWQFKSLTKNATLHNEAPNSAIDALGREGIQNRLDALAKNQQCVEANNRLCSPVDPSSKA